MTGPTALPAACGIPWTTTASAASAPADGNYHWDLLDERGKVLLEDIQSYRGGDVYAVLDDGQYALQRLDGTILYRHGADETATGEICVLPPNTQE